MKDYVPLIVAGAVILICVMILIVLLCRTSRRTRTIEPPIHHNRHLGRLDVQSPAPVDLDQLEQQMPSQLTNLDQMEEDPHQQMEEDHMEQGLRLGLQYGNDCGICNEVMDGRATIGKILRCGHAFHRSCIFQWYNTRVRNRQLHNCPICRNLAPAELVITKVIPTRINSVH